MVDCGCNAGGMCNCYADANGIIYDRDGKVHRSYANQVRVLTVESDALRALVAELVDALDDSIYDFHRRPEREVHELIARARAALGSQDTPPGES